MNYDLLKLILSIVLCIPIFVVGVYFLLRLIGDIRTINLERAEKIKKIRDKQKEADDLRSSKEAFYAAYDREQRIRRGGYYE